MFAILKPADTMAAPETYNILSSIAILDGIYVIYLHRVALVVGSSPRVNQCQGSDSLSKSGILPCQIVQNITVFTKYIPARQPA